MPDFHDAMRRLASDVMFRAAVLENTDAALAGYTVSSEERDQVLEQAEMIEAEVQTDPLESTESDQGQADAAGSKD